jgi:hypothetical protein
MIKICTAFKVHFRIQEYISQLLKLLLQNFKEQNAVDPLQSPGLYHQSKVKSLQYTLSISKMKNIILKRGQGYGKGNNVDGDNP